jgi:hypothetical protein
MPCNGVDIARLPAILESTFSITFCEAKCILSLD